MFYLGFPDSSVGKEFTCNAGGLSLIPGWEDSPGEGTGYPLQYSDMENSMNCIVHGGHKDSDTTELLSLSHVSQKAPRSHLSLSTLCFSLFSSSFSSLSSHMEDLPTQSIFLIKHGSSIWGSLVPTVEKTFFIPQSGGNSEVQRSFRLQVKPTI